LTLTADSASGVRRTHAQALLRRHARTTLNAFVALWVFSGAVVMFEPAPYEVLFLAVLGLMLLAGTGVHRGTLGLLTLIAGFTPFAFIAVFQARMMETPMALLYSGVTIFLMVTSFAVANYVADAPEARMRVINRAYLWAALLSAVLGIVGYLGLVPFSELLVRYDRAKALFNDPNVFGPFLVLPAMVALRVVLMQRGRSALWNGLAVLILFVGVFVSFSRGAWAHFAASALIVIALTYVLEAKARDQVRIIMLALAGTLVLMLALAALLSIEPVANLFLQRFSLTQSYDTGDTGRFGRIGYAFELAVTHPWGLGPMEFSTLSIVEQPHNTYLNVIHAYGWGGGALYIALILITLWKGFVAVLAPSPIRPLLIPVVATYIPLIALSAIIDTDHWRHFFLVTGLIWGLAAAVPGAISASAPRAAPSRRSRRNSPRSS